MIARAWKAQQGTSLLELMIAVTLGLLIVGAMIALFGASKYSYRLNENLARLQENARFAVSFISRDLRMADFHLCVTAENDANAVSGESDSGLNGSDSITVTWQSNACDAAFSTLTTTYSVQTGATGIPALFRNVDGTSVELVEGIDNLQIWYGEDTDNDNIPNYFVDLDNVTNMARVVGIRLTLGARTLDDNLASGGGAIVRSFTTTVALRNRLP